MAESQLERIMSNLRCSKEEAEAVLEYDKKVDRHKKKDGKLEFDLTDQQEKDIKKYINVGTRRTPPAYNWTQRERKKNATKASIIAELAKFLAENSENAVENCEITNAERMIHFKIGDNEYDLTLIQKRKPK